jgi:nucleobase:cation symporter-1, NCS1 family
MSSTSPSPGFARFIESHTIDAIPAGERHGRTRDLFNIWFAANINPLTIVTGALAVTAYGLPLWAGLLAVAIGNLGGAFLMALHSAQGPQLGVPQMIQSRGQFGNHGSLLIVLVVIFMYEGFFASNLVVGGQSLHQAVPALSVTAWLVISAVVGFLVAVVGYDLIHLVGRYATLFSVMLLIISAIWVLGIRRLPSHALSAGGVHPAGFIAMISVGVIYQVAYAPYVSDYSRYMPSDRASRRSTLWSTYWGCSLGAGLPMLLGVAVAAAAGPDVLGGLHHMLGGVLALIVLIGFTVVIFHLNSMNLYGSVLCLATAVQTFRPRWLPSRVTRVALMAAMLTIALVLALAFQSTFLASYTNFLAVLEYLLIPWTAINLIDFYLLRHGNYDVAAFFAGDGGRYGRLNVAALGTYLFGVVVEIPFMSTPVYTGPVALALGGTDITWIVGLVATTLIYWCVGRLYLTGQESAPVEHGEFQPETSST